MPGYNRPMPTRREFLRRSAAAAAAASLPSLLGRDPLAFAGIDRKEALAKPLALRDLGRTGIRVSCLGLGCYYLGNLADEEKAVAVVKRAAELGVNWFDTAPSYGPRTGVSEDRVGRALRGLRDRVRIATKSTCRDGAGALKDLEGSLRRLGTDRVDLFQFHALKDPGDVKGTFGEKGAFEALEKARRDGKVLHLGFSGHFDPDLVAGVCRERSLETVLMPLNALDPHQRSFEKGALPAAREKGMGVIAMKVFVSGRLVSDPALSPTAAECLRYALSLPVSTAIVGCSTVEELETDLALAKTFAPMDAKEREALLERTRPFVAKDIEWYKR